jgi:hypothetical protein
MDAVVSDGSPDGGNGWPAPVSPSCRRPASRLAAATHPASGRQVPRALLDRDIDVRPPRRNRDTTECCDHQRGGRRPGRRNRAPLGAVLDSRDVGRAVTTAGLRHPLRRPASSLRCSGHAMPATRPSHVLNPKVSATARRTTQKWGALREHLAQDRGPNGQHLARSRVPAAGLRGRDAFLARPGR